MPDRILVIACGALSREIAELRKANGWDHLDLASIDAWLHNRPEKIPGRLRSKIRQFKDTYKDIFVAYADCGTGGEIDKVLAEEGVQKLPGAHCYEFYAGASRFAELSEAEPGTFYLTDFLAQHFERFVIKPLKLDTHPELRDSYFGNYRRLVYLSQSHDAKYMEEARSAAQQLGLGFEHIHCGYGDLGRSLTEYVMREPDG